MPLAQQFGFLLVCSVPAHRVLKELLAEVLKQAFRQGDPPDKGITPSS